VVPIHSLPQEWLWCEAWCSDQSKPPAGAAGAVAPAVRGLKASLFPSFPQSVFTLPEDLQEYVRKVQQEQQALRCSRIGSRS
jgi:hypothetical protein